MAEESRFKVQGSRSKTQDLGNLTLNLDPWTFLRLCETVVRLSDKHRLLPVGTDGDHFHRPAQQLADPVEILPRVGRQIGERRTSLISFCQPGNVSYTGTTRRRSSTWLGKSVIRRPSNS